MNFEKNEGVVDRTLRAIIGLVALYFSYVYSLWWLVLAVPAIVTALTGYCKLYSLMGINTNCNPEVKITPMKEVKKAKKKKF